MGIYIHIPFCKQKCHYCDFHFSTSLKYKDEMLNALCKELELQKDYFGKTSIETIYFGGGTPSFLETEEIKMILNKVYEEFNVVSNPEITLEGNPDDFTFEKLSSLKAAGVNRLSIGIQSFNDEDLKWMNRAHDSSQATECVENAQQLGFDNITIDLIYGIPNRSMKDWKNNLKKALDLNIQHISAYNLTVEEGTALHHFVKTGKSKNVNDDDGAEQFQLLIETLEANGFIQYEISNFGKKGFYSKHNSSYWRGKKYLGIGPSAHSFDGIVRQWNISNNIKYINALKNGTIPFESEELTTSDRFNEYILLGLRTIWGCDFVYIEKEFGTSQLESLKEGLLAFGDKIEIKENDFYLTKTGKPFADKIASELFV